MPDYKMRAVVTLKSGVLDPQGSAIEGALKMLGFGGVNQIRQGKVFDIEVTAPSRKDAEKNVMAMCEKLLSNTVIENFSVEFQ